MTTLCQVADALETKLEGISGLRVYSEPDEAPNSPTAEIIFASRTDGTLGGGSAGQNSQWEIEVSVTSEDRGWSRAVRALLPYLDSAGTSSIQAAIEADNTLGGVVESAAVFSAGPMRRVQYGDGWRWWGVLTVDVMYT